MHRLSAGITSQGRARADSQPRFGWVGLSSLPNGHICSLQDINDIVCDSDLLFASSITLRTRSSLLMLLPRRSTLPARMLGAALAALRRSASLWEPNCVDRAASVGYVLAIGKVRAHGGLKFKSGDDQGFSAHGPPHADLGCAQRYLIHPFPC